MGWSLPSGVGESRASENEVVDVHLVLNGVVGERQDPGEFLEDWARLFVRNLPAEDLPVRLELLLVRLGILLGKTHRVLLRALDLPIDHLGVDITDAVLVLDVARIEDDHVRRCDVVGVQPDDAADLNIFPADTILEFASLLLNNLTNTQLANSTEVSTVVVWLLMWSSRLLRCAAVIVSRTRYTNMDAK